MSPKNKETITFYIGLSAYLMNIYFPLSFNEFSLSLDFLLNKFIL
jgi:hypothetical protein